MSYVVVLKICELRLTKIVQNKIPLYSSNVYLHSISLICNRMLYNDGTVYNLSIE